MGRSRRFVIGCLVAGVVVALELVAFNQAPAQTPTLEKPIKWNLNTEFMPVGYVGQGSTWFCDQVRARSNGRFIISPYFASALGFKGTEALSVMKKRLAEVTNICLVSVAGQEPLGNFPEFPFLFGGDAEKTWRFLSTVYWPEWKKVAKEKWNCIAIGPYMLGDLDIYSNKPIRNLSDLKNMKIRSGAPGVLTDGLNALGAQVFLISTSELFTALQRGMIDACITTEVGAVESKIWEVLKYNFRLKMGFIFSCLAINDNAFEALPKDLQGVLLEMDEAFKVNMLGERKKMVVEFRKQLVDHGIVEIIPSPEFKAQALESCRPVWEKYAGTIGPLGKELLEKAKKF